MFKLYISATSIYLAYLHLLEELLLLCHLCRLESSGICAHLIKLMLLFALVLHCYSSAGASSPAVPVNICNADRSGLGQGPKGGTLSGAGSRLPWNSLSTSAGESALGSSQPSCRPWEREDLLKRLATFKPANWSGKPKVCCLKIIILTMTMW
jgi:hypothetical protein